MSGKQNAFFLGSNSPKKACSAAGRSLAKSRLASGCNQPGCLWVVQQWMGDQQASLLWQCLWPDLPSHAYFGEESMYVPDASWRS